MPVERLADMSDARLGDYRGVPDPELLRRGDIFVAEGREVVRTLLTASPLKTRSVLVTETALDALRDVIEPRLAALPVFVVDQGAIQALTGFNIHRGCLAIGERPAPVLLKEFLEVSSEAAVPPRPEAATLVVLEQIVNADNVGSIFRNAAAFGADAVVLGPNCCDPLYRKAIRTSMGAALRVPFVQAGAWPASIGWLRAAGFRVAALTPARDAVEIRDVVREWQAGCRVALLAGSEGPGLTAAALDAADVRMRIPMAAGVDSVNVATAVAIALHRLTDRRNQDSGFRNQAEPLERR
jgi:tRNA G18 (ribose-2'-O)-methylase SpoU